MTTTGPLPKEGRPAGTIPGGTSDPAGDAMAWPTLSPGDLAYLEQRGSRRPIQPGDYLYREGDPDYDFYVLVSGAVEITVGTGATERLIARHNAGRFLGELNLLTGLRVFVTARVVEAGEVIVIPRDELRRIIAMKPKLGDLILSAFLARRQKLLTGATESIRVIGSRFLPETLHIREYLTRRRIPFEWHDPEQDDQIESLMGEWRLGPDDLPVVIVSGEVLRRVTVGGLASYLGLTVESLGERCFDLVVVGGGPAGLAAGVYGASEGLKTLVLEKVAVGGQAGTSSRIENYLGFPMGISGGELTQRATVQAEKFGAYLSSPCAVRSVVEEGGHLTLHLTDGTDVTARAVIAATGAKYRRLDVERLETFEGTGVYYAATEMEARTCATSPVVVVGGGNSAGQAAIFLAQSGSPVTMVVRSGDLGKSMSRYLVDRILGYRGIEVILGAEVTGLEGYLSLSGVRVTAPEGERTISCSGLFSFIGAEPGTAWLSGCTALDQRGFVLTDLSLDDERLGERWQALRRRPLPFETSHPGLFSVGDMRSGSMKRVASAVGEGSAAVRSVHEYLAFDHAGTGR